MNSNVRVLKLKSIFESDVIYKRCAPGILYLSKTRFHVVGEVLQHQCDKRNIEPMVRGRL
jgi:hypothetical protein